MFFQVHYKGKGFRQFNGNEYNVQQNITDSFHDVDLNWPSTVWVINEHGVVIGKDQAPNYSYRFQAKLIIANGTVVMDSVTFDELFCEFLYAHP